MPCGLARLLAGAEAVVDAVGAMAGARALLFHVLIPAHFVVLAMLVGSAFTAERGAVAAVLVVAVRIAEGPVFHNALAVGIAHAIPTQVCGWLAAGSHTIKELGRAVGVLEAFHACVSSEAAGSN